MKTSIVPDYKTRESEVIVRYEIKAQDETTFHECLHQLITKLSSDFKNKDLIHCFDLNQDLSQCQIAFDEKLFEAGNISQILTVIFDLLIATKIPASLKLLDIKWPNRLRIVFPGPSHEPSIQRQISNVYDRPLSTVELLPKDETNIKEYLEKAYHIWMGGCDLVQDSEIMTSLGNNEYSERVNFLSKESNNCSERCNNPKKYIPNVTAGKLSDIEFRITKAKEAGLSHVLINAIPVGFVAISSIAQICRDHNLVLCANLSGHQLYSKQQNFQISAKVLALIYRYLGVDQLEIEADISEDNLEVANILRNKFHEQSETHLACLPIYRNIEHPGEIEAIVKHFGHDLVIKASACVFDHPHGIKAGAEAFQYAIESAAQGLEKNTAAESNDNFKKALEIWDK